MGKNKSKHLNSQNSQTQKASQIPTEIQNEIKYMALNGLSEAVMGFNPGGIGEQLTQTTTLFKNNRWYLVSNMRQLLSECYVEQGLIKTIVDVPIDDGMRGGVEIISKQLGAEEIEKLQVEMEQKGDLDVMAQALKWTRLFGGGGVLILTDQDPATPLQIESIKPGDRLEFRDVDMWELFWSKQNIEDTSVRLDKLDDGQEYFDYYGERVHKSRVIVMKGMKAPSFVRPRLRGWGLSVVENLVNSINNYLKANNLTFEVLDEFKIDVFKIKNLSSTLLAPDGERRVHQRVQLANREKNFQHAITMDAEDDYLQKELSFSGLAETMTGIRMQVAADMRMPLTKLFGVSSAGFNSGEADIENYNAMIESEVRTKSKHHIIKIIEMRCLQMFGLIPEDLKISFKPLRVLGAEQEQNVKNAKYDRLMRALEKGAITVKEFKDAVNKENLLPVQIDTNIDELISTGNDEDVDSDQGEVESGSKSTTESKDAPVAKNDITLESSIKK